MGIRDNVSASGLAVAPTSAGLTVTTSTAPAPSRAVGATIPPDTLFDQRYRIVSLLGQGGMGAVYKAEDLKLNRVVAIKVIRREFADDAHAMARFKQELVLAREVTHRNVVRLYDIGDVGDMDFITMEFINGEDLGSILERDGKLDPGQAVDIVSQICSGLEAAHKQGIVHRDLKPGNIMRDGTGRIVIMDFGLARAFQDRSATETVGLVGTMEYMSPEQARGAHVDARSDLFSLGLIFYELLTGKRPYQADSAVASLVKRTQERAQPPVTVDHAVPKAISDICSKCLEANVAERYQSADELLTDLEAWKHGAAPGASAIARKLRRSLRGWHIAVITAVLLGAIAAWVLPRLTVKPAQQHAPVTVLVADFVNHTGDPVIDGAVEQMFTVAIEGATFVNSFDRSQARKLAGKLPNPTNKLDEQSARLVAVSQGVSAVVTGAVSPRDQGYKISVEAMDARTGKSIAATDAMAANKDEVLRVIPKLAAPIRKALGDATPESAQFAAVTGAFTAASLEAVHQDVIGMQQEFAGKFEDALQSFSKAAQLDPNFAAAYSGMAAMSANLGKSQDAVKYMKTAMEHEDRMTERERYRNRGLFYATTGNWHKCVDEYTELVKRYPADRTGQFNLASCLAQVRDLPRAVEAAQRAVEIVPKGAFQRLNLSGLSSFSGDFNAGEEQARAALELNPSSSTGQLMIAEAKLGQGQFSEATQAFQLLEKMGPLGASIATTGLADIAIYEGRYDEASKLLESGSAADVAAKMPDAAASKLAALAYVHSLRGHSRAAIAAVEKALVHSQGVSIRFLAARIYVGNDDIDRAQKLAASLGAELQEEPQAYAAIIQGMIAMKRGDASAAIKSMNEANKLLDTWIGRFELGRAYLAAGAFIEADSEFERCIKRRGEALELFMDNVLTYGFLPPVYYYQGRVREGLKSPNSAASYRTYLEIRGAAGQDPLLPEVRQKLAH